MKFLLVMPRSAPKPKRHYEFPLGTAYIASAIRDAGHEVVPLNLNPLDLSVDVAVREMVERHKPDVCAAGTLSPFMSQIETIFATAKRAKPDIVTVAGSGIVSGDPDLALNFLDMDYGVMGEGEETIVELAEALERGTDPGKVRGLVFQDANGERVTTPRRPIIRDVDSIAWPDYDSFGIEDFLDAQTRADNWFFHTEDDPRSLPMIGSRSCIYNCNFCYHPLGKTYRQRSLDGLFEELEHNVARYKPSMISFLDELFSTGPERILEFCERIKPLGLKWMFSLHVTSVNPEAIRAMRDSGCGYVAFGLENIHPVILRNMRKKSTPPEIEKALSATHDNQVGLRANIIFGDPEETLETANHNMLWWSRNRHLQIDLLCLQVMPGSRVYAETVASGRFKDLDDRCRNRLINVSKIDDRSIAHMRLKLMVFQQTLLRPATVSRFEKQKIPHPVRGPLYAADVTCPHCGAELTYVNLPLDHDGWYQSLRLTCKVCHNYLHIQNMARRPWIEPDVERMYEEASAHRAAGRVRDALAGYRKIHEIHYPSDSTDRPRAHIHALFDMGTLLGEIGELPFDATYYLGEAVLLNAFDPNYHLAYGQALANEGSTTAARMHFEQAARLISVTGPEGEQTRRSLLAFAESLPEPPTGYGFFQKVD